MGLRQRIGRACLAVAFLSLPFGGCSSTPALTSTQMTGDVRSPVRNGVTYYLPKRVLQLGVWESVEVEITTIDRNKEEMKESPPRLFATVMDVKTVPDRNYLMRMTYNPSPTYHDAIRVTMSPEGLLSEVETTFRDEGPAIVAKLAELATALAKVPSGLSLPRKKAAVGNRRYETRTRLLSTLMVDPTDPASYQSQLANYGITLEATPSLGGADACCTLVPERPCEPVCTKSGVCYRPVIPFDVGIRSGGILISGIGVEVEHGIQDVYMLPNRSPVVCLPIERVAFVESSFHLTFDRGLLTSMSTNKPSEVLGFLEIPIRVAKAIVSIPAELFQFKVTHYENARAAASSEQQALEAIRELQKAQQDPDGG